MKASPSTCPACGYRGAFTATERDGKRLYHCFSGCSQTDLLAAIKGRRPVPYHQAHKTHQRVNLESLHYVQRLWHESQPAAETLAACYLASRGLSGPIPPALRFLPDHPHKPTETHRPVMLAAVTDIHGRIQAVHRTYLASDGKGKALVEPAKMTLGPVGGYACHLSPAGKELAISEGIETGLAVQFSTGIPTWAALSAGGMHQLVLPPLPLASEIVVAADADPVGIQAAYDTAARFVRMGRRTRIAIPPTGKDFNDVLREAAA